VKRRDEKIASERFFDLLSKEIRHLQPTLLVETGRSASTKAIHSFKNVVPSVGGTTFSHF
jgi:hypothetical protein